MRSEALFCAPDGDTVRSFVRQATIASIGGEARESGRSAKAVQDLDAVVVGSPVNDGLLDGLGIHVFGEGAVGEVGELGVGGEAEGDELGDGELVDVSAVCGGEECLEAETLFEADDAVLGFEGGATGCAGYQEEDDGHDDPPEIGVLVSGPSVNGDVDGEDEVEQEQGKDDEVKEWVEPGVVLEVLRGGHGESSLREMMAGPA